uniref:Uncharacterized protein n=1 Tax=Callithrix jacchus TaxID=9483 RepID=A0A8I4A5I2_CALJA
TVACGALSSECLCSWHIFSRWTYADGPTLSPRLLWHDHGSSQLPDSQAQAILPLQSPKAAGITGEYHHAWLIFVFFVKMGFYHVAQAGLKLLSPRDIPALTYQSAGITGMSRHAWTYVSFL